MPEKKGLFARLFSGLSKTRGNLTEKVDEITREDRKIDEDFYEELEDALLLADCGVKATTVILDELREQHGIRVFPIVTVREVIAFLHNNPVDGKVYIDDEMKARMEAYLAEYGARA